MSDYITGELVRVGTYSEAEQPFGETSLACAVVCMDREQLKIVRALPMYDRVAIIRTAELEELERENAKLRSNFMAAESEIILFREERDELRARLKASDGWDDYSAIKELQRENAELKIERNRYKVALQDIALANDQWPGYKAREVLGKEAQP